MQKSRSISITLSICYNLDETYLVFKTRILLTEKIKFDVHPTYKILNHRSFIPKINEYISHRRTCRLHS
jgi:hypothetical protein